MSCCCTVPHYSANSCEKHVSTAARKIVQNGCEVKVARIYTNGEDHKLFEGRREKSSRLAQYEQFLVEMLGMLAEDAKKPPTTDDYPDPTEHLKAVVRYAYADLLRDRIERFRNSLGKR